MTIQRITNLLSAPISACLRAFVLAAGTGCLLNSRPNSSPCSSADKIGNTVGMNMSNLFKGDSAYVTGITQGNSAQLRGSA